MAFIEYKTLDGESVTVNTNFIFKIFRHKKKLGASIIAYDYELEVSDDVAESYTELIKRINEAEEGEPDADSSGV